MKRDTEMASFISCINDNCKDKSYESIDNKKDILYDCIDNVSKIENYNKRSVFYKKPIKKHNYKLELDSNDTPQEIRRQRILYHQKKNRNAIWNDNRGVLKEIFNSDSEEEIEVNQVKEKKIKLYKRYSRLLMLSEWMLEVPQDFAEKWIMVPCPVGKRVLIVACKGLTKMYTRKGLQICVFKTMLPGGSKETCKNSYTILDCIWLKTKKICYVLDVLVWSNQEMHNCEAEFRLFWVKAQLQDLHNEQRSNVNDYHILSLPNVTCDLNFYECLESISTSVILDGLLFYHKEGLYINGKTPLVTWLKTYMLPEVLGMNVPEPYDEKPNNYINFEHHVLKIIKNEKEKIKNMQKRKKSHENFDQEDME